MVPFGFARALSFKLGALKWLVWLARGVPSRAQRVNSSNTRIDKANSRVSPLFLYLFRQNGKKRVKSNATNSHHRWQFVITSGGGSTPLDSRFHALVVITRISGCALVFLRLPRPIRRALFKKCTDAFKRFRAFPTLRKRVNRMLNRSLIYRVAQCAHQSLGISDSAGRAR